MKNVKIEEIGYKRGNVNENDVFILDMGEHIYQVCTGVALMEISELSYYT